MIKFRLSAFCLVCTLVFASRVATGAIQVYTDRATWAADVMAFAGFDELRIENFNGLQTQESLQGIAPGVLGFGTGPGSFGSGDVSFDFSDTSGDINMFAVGGDDTSLGVQGSSQTGVISGGEFNGTNAFTIRSVEDVSNFEFIPGINLAGEGIESFDFQFNVPVFAFGGQFNSGSTHDSFLIQVNDTDVPFHDHYPDDTNQDGDGFLGVLDTAGISEFSLVEGGADAGSTFEEYELENFEYGLTTDAGNSVIPEPTSVIVWSLLGLTVAGACGLRRRR